MAVPRPRPRPRLPLPLPLPPRRCCCRPPLPRPGAAPGRAAAGLLGAIRSLPAASENIFSAVAAASAPVAACASVASPEADAADAAEISLRRNHHVISGSACSVIGG